MFIYIYIPYHFFLTAFNTRHTPCFRRKPKKKKKEKEKKSDIGWLVLVIFFLCIFHRLSCTNEIKNIVSLLHLFISISMSFFLSLSLSISLYLALFLSLSLFLMQPLYLCLCFFFNLTIAILFLNCTSPFEKFTRNSAFIYRVHMLACDKLRFFFGECESKAQEGRNLDL